MKKFDSRNIENILALTPLQEGLLFHYLQDPQTGLYFEQLNLEIAGAINCKCFEEAWNVVIQSNELLRTVFRWEKLEKPSQFVLKKHDCRFAFHDLSNENANQRHSVREEIKRKDRRENFDLHEVPFRVILCKLDAMKYEMVISNHHILYDGWSNGIILKEFFYVYHSLITGKDLKISAKPSFKEFIKWSQDQNRHAQHNFWKEYLAGFESPTQLPIKKKTGETGNTVRYGFYLTEDLNEKLADFIRDFRVTLAAVFYTAWGILLQRYGGCEDVVFGTTVSGRSAPVKGIEDMVGLFIKNFLNPKYWI